ncbi:MULTISPECIES: NUDIX hydrolase [Nocardia]|uniref:NTP pyrophosphohydrolases containing a Zn-finger, probably nucleic-acid-binding n=1 Tax=Nocardia farcinica TaxID=37329 RepID=A0A449GQ21_NOCFR|nr:MULTISPECIES: NUDIX domain-containing protein [Nocardia]MBF6068362.1 NUDIX domain-containing protein [Nocardia farcinica]MBF6186217.1 NUDIX domain-containing protein [Nocardia farcinica]MBF6231517.1 NUDIX domain-containing protein [Nocardia farcinica]MBF6269166.1 NUDIX domain-containing protein [Nocardia farcinica]MBF6313480.1 NUDIX domain-containing protein [Nocardia farcinica]
MIRTAAFAHVRDRRLLQARSTGKEVFYMAGGKIDAGETPEQAMHREVREELGVDVVSYTELGIFRAAAYGHEPGVQLHMTCFTGVLDGDPTPSGEIAELRYFTVGEYGAMRHVAPGSLLVFQRLYDLGIIDW